MQDLIGESAFEGTKWLEDNRNSEASALIVNNILVDGKNMSGDIVISPDITSINSDAFIGNTEMTSVTISEGVMDSLGDTFADCRGLTTISLHDSITEIDAGESDRGGSSLKSCIIKFVHNGRFGFKPAIILWQNRLKCDILYLSFGYCFIKNENNIGRADGCGNGILMSMW